ncbi:NUDIX hydrolase [Ruegeria sp. 2012CJ41-6]|uniref:NUDIX hydrolase n=1 Tax=Ruegeria spongiae TaxID=2942209 RepID=A0ABT0PYX7_9RHOB|nr:NUDIX hydrolase [Ruegeria spongiae]MCL6282833.1 NUDIX hydrolase [Ruegeria spongiae]
MTQVPRIGALAVVLRDGKVLLARRRNNPDAGLWGFPGGHVEWGETVLAAATRELREETGIHAEPIDYLTNLDLLQHGEDGNVELHYLLVGVACRYVGGTLQAADDVSDAQWFDTRTVLAGELAMSARVPDLLGLALRSGFW